LHGFALSDRSSVEGEGQHIHNHERNPRDRVVCEVSKSQNFMIQNLTKARNHLQASVVIKSVEGHPRVENERDLLKRFQHRTPYLRPLIDEIDEPSAPVTIALKHLQGDLLSASVERTLNRRELKYVSRRVLEALKTLHEDGFVHTGIKAASHQRKTVRH
jgi:serine/threonine protein kinase